MNAQYALRRRQQGFWLNVIHCLELFIFKALFFILFLIFFFFFFPPSIIQPEEISKLREEKRQLQIDIECMNKEIEMFKKQGMNSTLFFYRS